jgi:Fe-S-cluster containining protein
VEEGIVRWDLGRPYWNLRDATGYCIHNDPEKRCCNIYEARPGPCRSYDCRQDKRIWLDFETMIVNPHLAESIAGSRG